MRGATTVWGRLLGIGDRLRGQDAGQDVASADRILVARLDEIGDCLMTTPFLRSLRASAPTAQICLMIPPPTAELFRDQSFVDRVVAFDRRANTSAVARAVRALRAGLEIRRSFAPQVVILPRRDVELPEALTVAATCGASTRIAYSERETPNRRRYGAGTDKLMTRVLSDPVPRHEVERNLRLLEFAGGKASEADLRLEVGEHLMDNAGALLAGVAPEARLVAIGIGARSHARCWPVHCFAEACNSLLASTSGVAAVVLGVASDGPLAEEFAHRFAGETLDLTGRTTVAEALAVLRRCILFIGNDSGPMHLAAAAGIPVVEVSGLPSGSDPQHANAPERFGPWGVPNRVVRPSAGAEETPQLRIEDVSVESVVAAARALWQPVPPP